MATAQARDQEVSINILELPMHASSSLTIPTKTVGGPCPFTRDKRIPDTFVAGRNLLFLSNMLSLGYPLGIKDYFIGTNTIDYSGYPDCKPEFIIKLQEVLQLAVDDPNIYIHRPLTSMSKAIIIKTGRANNVNLSKTWSCYNPKHEKLVSEFMPRACGVCDSCRYRLKGFQEVGIKDPLDYV
jgi:7-cyano-7-deazaguanine synthase